MVPSADLSTVKNLQLSCFSQELNQPPVALLIILVPRRCEKCMQNIFLTSWQTTWDILVSKHNVKMVMTV